MKFRERGKIRIYRLENKIRAEARRQRCLSNAAYRMIDRRIFSRCPSKYTHIYIYFLFLYAIRAFFLRDTRHKGTRYFIKQFPTRGF